MNYKNVTWNGVEVLVNRLTAKIQSAEAKFDFILSLNRGGLIPGVMLSHRLKIKNAVMSIESYSGQNRGRLRGGDSISIVKYPKKKSPLSILIVDDVADSGESFKFAVNHIEKLKIGPFHYEAASLHWKPKSIFKPQYIGEEIENDIWINYPWESNGY